MTGFNHYPSCTCGWCVYSDRSHVRPERFRAEFAQRDAEILLKQHSVNSFAGCYVNPNARCPVCSAPVFFYANRFGSRVYFDDLGPPWPKHPCTDNPKFRAGSAIVPGRISLRPKGLATELINAARKIGKQPERNLSKPMKAQRIEISGGVRTITLSGLGALGEGDSVRGEIPNCTIRAGDIVHVGPAEISYFDMEVFSPASVTFRPTAARITLGGLEGVREIVATWQRAGVTNPEQIAERLNHVGMRTPDGRMWHATTVQRVLLGYEVRTVISQTESKRRPARRRKLLRRPKPKRAKRIS